MARASQRLEGEEVPVSGGWLTEHHGDLIDQVRSLGTPILELEPPRLVVAAPDRRGLLSSVAGVLALHGLDVRSADASGRDGVAVEVFSVEVRRSTWPDADRLRRDLTSVLAGQLALDDQLAEKARDYARSRRPTSARPVVPRVLVDNEASATSTVVEIRASDEVGLLHGVTRALFNCNLDVVSARVSTIGSEVVDAFYVRDTQGAKVTDRAALSRLELSVRASIS